jgi:hypothetical protein
MASSSDDNSLIAALALRRAIASFLAVVHADFKADTRPIWPSEPDEIDKDELGWRTNCIKVSTVFRRQKQAILFLRCILQVHIEPLPVYAKCATPDDFTNGDTSG